MINNTQKLCLLGLLVWSIQACGEDSTSSKDGGASSTENQSSAREVSSAKTNSSTQKESSASLSSSEDQERSSSSASSSSGNALGTLIGRCNKPFSTGDVSVDGSFCNEIWTADPISDDSLSAILNGENDALGLICNTNGISNFEAGKSCVLTNAIVGCQLEDPQQHGDDYPPTVTVVYSIANDEKAKAALTAYHNTLEGQTDSPCPNSSNFKQVVVLDNREESTGGLACDIPSVPSEMGNLGHVCMEFTDGMSATMVCDMYKSQGISVTSEDKCSGGPVLTCDSEGVKVYYYDKAKAPEACEE